MNQAASDALRSQSEVMSLSDSSRQGSDRFVATSAKKRHTWQALPLSSLLKRLRFSDRIIYLFSFQQQVEQAVFTVKCFSS